MGRMYLYGLAAAGAAGVHRMLELLETEVRIALGLLGATSFAQVDKSSVQPAPSVTTPHVFSAFPLLTVTEEMKGKY
jgi:glycolate oxidase